MGVYSSPSASSSPAAPDCDSMPSGAVVSGYEFRDQYGANVDTAYLAHGDLFVKFWVSSTTSKPDPSIIDNLITRQLGRL